MSFATVAATLLLFSFGVYAAGYVMSTMQRSERELAEAHRAQAEHAQALATGSVRVDNRTWNDTLARLDLQISNTGGIALSAGMVTVILDGAYANDKITQRDIGGSTTEIWGPGEQLHLRLEMLAAEPARAWIIADTGAAAVG